MTGPHAAADLQKLATEWISAWNARDLERVLKLYTDDAEMTSPYIVTLGFDATARYAARKNCAPIGPRR